MNTFISNIEEELSTFKMLNTRDNLNDEEKNSTCIKSLNIKNNKNLETSFYNLESLKIKCFNDIYTILNRCNMIIFVDNKKLQKNKKNSCFFRKKKINILEENFDSCTFFSYEFSRHLLNYIFIFNNKIHDSELNNTEICQDNELCNQILFDNNLILKNNIYKKLEIQNKILFIPINKYKVKYTEYKIRGFCQIAEELGAKNILIKFHKTNTKLNKTTIKSNISTEQMLAGNLGFAIKTTENDDENRSYTLDYPSNNTINLNEELIKYKIRKKKLIINDNMFNSNLELQYLISARCRHYITKYSAVFTFDSKHTLDFSLVNKFKIYGINLDLDYSNKSNSNDFVSIITDVTFSDINDNIGNLSGCKVNLDETGFNFLIQSLKDADFPLFGIYKIIDFIEMYIEKILIKYNNDYNIVKTIQKSIEENITLEEYAKILSTYFNKKSQWVHLINFINLLRFKTNSYDKLGYLIIVNKIYDSEEDKLWTIVNFIQQFCTKENIENKFWKMLQPFNKKIIYYLKTKLLVEYNFLNEFNWFNFLKFIECLKNYNDNISLVNNNEEDYFSLLIRNMNLGYKYWEYYNNILPYVKQKYFSLFYKEDLENINTQFFNYYFNFETFNLYKIDSIKKLEEFIKNKVYKISKSTKLKQILLKLFDENNNNMSNLLKIYDYFNSKDFNSEFKYFKKKLNEILDDNSSESIVSLFKDETKNIDFKTLIKLFINKLLVYNEKINMQTLPINNLGFNKIYNNFKYGIKLNEFNKNIILFIKMLKSNIINKIETTTSITLEYFNENINNYYSLLIYLKEKENIDIPEYMFQEIF